MRASPSILQRQVLKSDRPLILVRVMCGRLDGGGEQDAVAVLGCGDARHDRQVRLPVPGGPSSMTFWALVMNWPVPRCAMLSRLRAVWWSTDWTVTRLVGMSMLRSSGSGDKGAARLVDAVGQALPADNATDIIATQRDMTGLLLSAHGMDRTPLRDWTGFGRRADFLEDADAEVPHEDDAIRHDWQHFPNWPEAAQVSWTEQSFTKGKRKLSIFYGNTRKLEHQTGVDLVYYNQTHGCFVCVQYKKLNNEPGTGWVYRPGSRLESELARMRDIDEKSRIDVNATDIRLLATPTFFKLHEPMEFEQGSEELVQGMYLSREHFELLLEKNRGDRNGRRIGYSTVPRFLNNSVFAELLGNGWIGTRGAGTDLVRDQVRRSMGQRRSVVVGITNDGLGNAHRSPRQPGLQRDEDD
jgi:hypothetical protein